MKTKNKQKCIACNDTGIIIERKYSNNISACATLDRLIYHECECSKNI